MPRFHFNIYDGYSTLDEEGTELPDLQSARVEAIRFAGLVLAQEVQKLASTEDWRMEVTDAAGRMLFRLDFRIDDSAAASAAGVSEAASRPQA